MHAGRALRDACGRRHASVTLYNEIEPYAARWLENLAAKGHIADGRVETRSIVDLEPADVGGPGQRHFFAGIGGWSYALRLAGIPDGASVWTGSCPCQPFSTAGKRAAEADARHLWPAWFRLIRECHPPIVLGEQTAGPDGLRWLDLVSSDLEGAGYAFGAADLCAAGVAAPHIRQRLYFVAYADEAGRGEQWREELRTERDAPQRNDVDGCSATGVVVDPVVARLEGHAEPGRIDADTAGSASEAGASRGPWSDVDWIPCSDGFARPVEPGTFPLAARLPGRVGRLRAYGNSIVPQVAAAFVRAAVGGVTWR